MDASLPRTSLIAITGDEDDDVDEAMVMMRLIVIIFTERYQVVFEELCRIVNRLQACTACCTTGQ